MQWESWLYGCGADVSGKALLAVGCWLLAAGCWRRVAAGLEVSGVAMSRVRALRLLKGSHGNQGGVAIKTEAIEEQQACG